MKVVYVVILGMGSLVVILGLLTLCLSLVWRSMDKIKLFRRLHAYIKEHKREFIEWNREYKREGRIERSVKTIK
jgi:hypothetical protein